MNFSPTFCEFAARFSLPKSEEGSTVPRKMDLNWFIPALVKSRVGSDKGATGEEGTICDHLVSMAGVVEGSKKKKDRPGITHQRYGHFA